MELLLAVAVMAVAVASWIIATTFRLRIRENTTQLAQLSREIAECGRRLQQAEKRLRTQSDHDQARWADEFETVRHQIGEAQMHLARHDAEIRQHQDRLSVHLRGIQRYVRAQLDHEVAATRGNPAHRVLAGGIYAEQPAALDILPIMYDSFLRELPLEMLFGDPADELGGRCYLSWTSMNGQSLERRLERLLRACPAGDAAPARGLHELRRLLLALHRAGPGTLQAGPLVVFRTSDQLAGAVLASTEAALLDDQPAVPAPKECRALLSRLGPGRLTDLGTWADSQSS